MKPELAVVWPAVPPPAVEEERYCLKFCKDLSRKACLEVQPETAWIDWDPVGAPGDVPHQGRSKSVLWVTDPRVLLNPVAVRRLLAAMESGYSACGPVYNQSPLARQRADMPALYLNLATYEEVAGLMETNPGPDRWETDRLDPACILYSGAFLERVSGVGLPAGRFDLLQPADFRAAVDCKALVHNFGRYDAGRRDDLIQLIPENASRVLDVGCAGGEYGRRLKEVRPDLHLTGIEPNPVLARKARNRYDEFYASSLESASLADEFDVINCGDVLEHLQDPWDMLTKLHSLLRRGGVLVTSLPNVGHWTVVRDLAAGTFQYIPWGLLCITHIRWFTEASIRNALAEAGFEIDVFLRQQIDPTPQGKAFIELMVRSGGNRASLLTNEFTIRARKP